jgi:hypothetical protein
MMAFHFITEYQKHPKYKHPDFCFKSRQCFSLGWSTCHRANPRGGTRVPAFLIPAPFVESELLSPPRKSSL